MDKFFLCFWGRPTDGTLPDGVTELSENVVLFNLCASAGWLSADELKSELLSRWLLYVHNPDLSLCIPKEDPQHPWCWGILIGLDGVSAVEKHLFLLELYTGHVFTPLYYIDRLGRPATLDYLLPRYDPFGDCWWDNLSEVIDARFLAFTKLVMPLVDTVGSIQMSDVDKWLSTNEDERFRFIGWLTLYARLREYSHWKDPIFWIREALDIGIILEIFLGKKKEETSFWSRVALLFSNEEAASINKVLRTTARTLLWTKVAWRKTVDLVHDIYEYRCSFAHGSFANDLRDSYESTGDWFARMKFDSDIFEKTKLWQEVLRKVVIMEMVLYAQIREGGFWDWITTVNQLLDMSQSDSSLRDGIVAVRDEVSSNCVW